MAIETKIIRRPLRWKKLLDKFGIPCLELRHGTACVGEVFRKRKSGWHFRCFDGRDSFLAEEEGCKNIGEAMTKCKAHVNGLSRSYQLPGICPKCGR